MNVTVKDLLELPIMQNGSKLLSDTGLDNIVQYVTVVEAPKIHFPNYGGHIFVLTTLSAYSESLDKINEFVRRLCEVSISAIGIKLGRFVTRLTPPPFKLPRSTMWPCLLWTRLCTSEKSSARCSPSLPETSGLP